MAWLTVVCVTIKTTAVTIIIIVVAARWPEGIFCLFGSLVSRRFVVGILREMFDGDSRARVDPIRYE